MKMKRILIVTNHFYPETFRCNDVAFHLAEKGYEVSVLTGIPDYPQGRFYKGYGVFRRRVETINGVRVYHSLLTPRGNGKTMLLMLQYLTSYVCMTVFAFFLGLSKRFDCILVHETSPIMLGTAANLIHRMQKIPMYFWVLDLWPESLQAAGGINNRTVLGFFEHLVKKYYRNSEKILISSKGFEESICQKGVFASKIEYFPNWADKDIAGAADEAAQTVDTSGVPEGFVVMFAGNVGEAQDFTHIMMAANELRERKDIHFVVLGDGRKKPWVDDFVMSHQLGETVHMLGRRPVEEMSAFFQKADLLLVALKDVNIFNLTLPAKVQAYMAAGKPIIAMMNGEGPRTIAEASGGFSVAAGDYKALARAIADASERHKSELEQMGENGLQFSQMHFSYEMCMKHLEEIIK